MPQIIAAIIRTHIKSVIHMPVYPREKNTPGKLPDIRLHMQQYRISPEKHRDPAIEMPHTTQMTAIIPPDDQQGVRLPGLDTRRQAGIHDPPKAIQPGAS